MFRVHRNTNSLTEKWLTSSSVIPTLGNWRLGKCQIVKAVQKYTVLTILPNRQLPNVGMTDDEVSHFSVRELAFRCKRNVCILMTTILEVNGQGFWRDFVCMHYMILRLKDDRTIRVGCNAWGKLRSVLAFNDFDISYDVRIFGYFSNWIHLLRLTLDICYLTLGAQIDFATEAMLCKVFRPSDGKPIFIRT